MLDLIINVAIFVVVGYLTLIFFMPFALLAFFGTCKAIDLLRNAFGREIK